MASFRGLRAHVPGRHDPWFMARPRLALAVAGVLYVAILVLRIAERNPLDAVSMLYMFPVALVAMAKGRWAGMVAGGIALVLVAVWLVADSLELSVLGWLSRGLPLLLVGFLIGDARDRLARASVMREAHTLALERHREAVEINDSLVQGMSAAKWSIEAGRTEAGLQVLGETVELGHRLVSDLIREAGAGEMTAPVDGGDASLVVASGRRTKVPHADDARP